MDYVLIDDTRFENEIYYPKAMFGDKVVAIRVIRTTPDFHSHLSEEQLNHRSETALDNFKGFDCVSEAKKIDELKSAMQELSKSI